MWWGQNQAGKQLIAARVWDLGASSSTMSMANNQAVANHLKIVLPTSFLFYCGPKGRIYHWYGCATGSSPSQGTVILRAYHKGSIQGMILLQEQIQKPLLPIHLMQEILVEIPSGYSSKNSDVIIPLPEYRSLLAIGMLQRIAQ